MATTPRRTLVRRACTVGVVAVAATVLGASSPIASATTISGTAKAGYSSLDNPASWAAVKAAAASGYALPAKFAANCGSQN